MRSVAEKQGLFLAIACCELLLQPSSQSSPDRLEGNREVPSEKPALQRFLPLGRRRSRPCPRDVTEPESLANHLCKKNAQWCQKLSLSSRLEGRCQIYHFLFQTTKASSDPLKGELFL